MSDSKHSWPPGCGLAAVPVLLLARVAMFPIPRSVAHSREGPRKQTWGAMVLYIECSSALGGSCERRGKNGTWQRDSGCAGGGSTLDRPQAWARTTWDPSFTGIGSPRTGQPKEDGGMVWGRQCIARLRLWLGFQIVGGMCPAGGRWLSLGSWTLSSSEIMSSPPPQSCKICLERKHCKDYRHSLSQAECGRASPTGSLAQEPARTRAHGQKPEVRGQ